MFVLYRPRRLVRVGRESRGDTMDQRSGSVAHAQEEVPGAVWFEWTNFLSKKGGFRSRQSISTQLRSMGLELL